MYPVLRRTASPLVAAAVLVAVAACSIPPAPAGSTPSARPSSTADEAAPTAPPAEGSLTYAVTGSGTAITIDYTPDAAGAADRLESVKLPWTKQVAVVGSPTLYEVVIVGGNDVGCTVTLDGKVVAQEPVGGSAHCIYQP